MDSDSPIIFATPCFLTYFIKQWDFTGSRLFWKKYQYAWCWLNTWEQLYDYEIKNVFHR